MTLGAGVAQQVKAFQEGFSQLYPIQDMQIFSTEEINVLCGNADEDWSRESELISPCERVQADSAQPSSRPSRLIMGTTWTVDLSRT